MLSILIPIYNYNAFPLVSEMRKQCLDCSIEFEIICQDDASDEFISENQAINTLENCIFSSNSFNLGRGKNINTLAQKARFDWLLILDCDTFPKDQNFIQNYTTVIEENESPVVFGGIVYESQKPEKEKLLRWIYGNKREALSIEKRIQSPANSALTSNLLIKKKLFLQYPFDASITKYGYEDLCFLTVLGTQNIYVSHIDNPTFHLNLETSEIFLEKTKTALENLAVIEESGVLETVDSKIIKAYSFLKTMKLTEIIAAIFKKSEAGITANLLSNNPSILLFDCYKLGYFCQIKSM
ncbi:glycosyltransferase family 2 protein [Flavobacterium maritimum]|uniref:glycosyltransferase family 2 protein n=1 Tax=Flavobacterium maritimum TaxID=3149042 RepID=UPI0032B5C19D